MKYLLLLGFLGMARARTYCNSVEMNVDRCGSTSKFSAYGGFYYCIDPYPVCPTGWEPAVSGTDIGGAIGVGNCYLMISDLPEDDVATICADTSGDFCPADQTPSNGVCKGDPCATNSYDKQACCDSKVLASDYINAQCCECE